MNNEQRVWIIKDEAGEAVMLCPKKPGADYLADVSVALNQECTVGEYLLRPATAAPERSGESADWRGIVENVISYVDKGLYDHKTAIYKLKRSLDDLAPAAHSSAPSDSRPRFEAWMTSENCDVTRDFQGCYAEAIETRWRAWTAALEFSAPTTSRAFACAKRAADPSNEFAACRQPCGTAECAALAATAPTGESLDIEQCFALAKQKQEARESLPVQGVPEGFVLVPGEPTPEMVKAMKDAWWKGCSAHVMKTTDAYRVYFAALSVAHTGASK